jgi:hypothetical protein
MLILNNQQLCNISGGINFSGTLINSFTSGIRVVLDVSRSLGTSIRRIMSNRMCPL